VRLRAGNTYYLVNEWTRPEVPGTGIGQPTSGNGTDSEGLHVQTLVAMSEKR
jgi:hypothetical protein